MSYRIEYGQVVDQHGLPTGHRVDNGRIQDPHGVDTGYHIDRGHVMGPRGGQDYSGLRIGPASEFVDHHGLPAPSLPFMSDPLPLREYTSSVPKYDFKPMVPKYEPVVPKYDFKPMVPKYEPVVPDYDFTRGLRNDKWPFGK